MRPTRLAMVFFAAVLPVTWILLVFDQRLWSFALVTSVAVLAAVVLDAILTYPRSRVTMDTLVPQNAFVGEQFEITLTVNFEERRRLPQFVELTIDLSGTSQPACIAAPLATLRPQDSTCARIRVATARRGFAQFEAAWVRWCGPFGLMQQTRVFPVNEQTRITPAIHASQIAAFEVSLRDALVGTKVQLHAGGGLEFDALRDHLPGHDSRFVDWKHSARHRKLLTKEFRAERNHSIVLAFDTGYLMQEPINGIARLDHSINSGLLLAWLALRSGDLVGSYSFNSRPGAYTSPARGAGCFRYLQRTAADLAYSTEETNFTLGLTNLLGLLDRRALIVLFTDFVDTITADLLVENAQRLAKRHLVVFVALRDSFLMQTFEVPPRDIRQMAKSVIAYDLMQGRNVVLERLKRLGIDCLDVSASRLSVELINRWIAIKQRGLL